MPLAQSTHTVADILTAVKRQFGDESGTQMNNLDIIRWVNQGQAEITRMGEVNKSTATTPSVAGQNQYTFTDNIFKIIAIFYNGQPLKNITFEQAQESFFNNLGVTPLAVYCPTTWYEWDDSIYLYPTPNNTGDVIQLYAIKAPTTVTSAPDVLSIPDTHFEALLQYVLQQAYELDDNWNGAQIKGGQMMSSMEDLMNTSSDRHYPVITVLPEDM